MSSLGCQKILSTADTNHKQKWFINTLTAFSTNRFFHLSILLIIHNYQLLFFVQNFQVIMKSIGKSFSTKPLQNLIGTFQGILIEKEVLDQPRRVNNFHYCKSQPKVRKNPRLAGLSKRVLALLGYEQQDVIKDQNTPHFLSGSKIIQGSFPMSHNYCGHQFGVWAGQLGDGRAHTIGNIKVGQKIYELQLKGSGLSPFSRHADGNSVVSSAVRQFLASQLMAGLGVPTTRALSLVIAEQDVIRDPFYNGKIKIQNSAIIVRVAQSLLRFGSFQVCNKGAQLDKGTQIENRKILKALADYLHKYYYKEIDEEQSDIYEQIFKDIVIKTAMLVAQWQSIGFVHGVLNTDNMSMISVTIDYGPFGFIDYFSKDFVSNATDKYQRYSYRHQPNAVKWNLTRLAQAFDTLIPYSILIRHIDNLYQTTYEKHFYDKMAIKLGLEYSQKSIKIIKQLFDVMHICRSNFTNTFRILSQNLSIEQKLSRLLMQSLPTQFYKQSFTIIQNKIKQQHIDSICAEDSGFNRSFLEQQEERRKMLQLLSTESCQDRTQRERKLWAEWLQQYENLKPNKEAQQKNTIKYVLLNEVAKNITEQLVKLDSSSQRQLLNKILEVFSNPYESNEWFEKKYWSKRPIPVRLTCSS